MPTPEAAPAPRRSLRRSVSLLLVLATLVGLSACRDPGPRARPTDRANVAIIIHVPARLRQAIPERVVSTGGNTSYSSSDGTITVGAGQMDDTWDHARFIAVHEFGHQVAFKFGTLSYLGAPPAGFPYTGRHPEEVFADCFATALTGVVWPTYGIYPVCPAASVNWTRNWVHRNWG